ncbi:MAG: hypothetical protein SGBAC_001457 [Bacillariaceae sp.]
MARLSSICVFACLAVIQARRSFTDLPVIKQTRQLLNFNNILGSPTSAQPYDRILGSPVFQVTTAWGSPYMNMEKMTDMNEGARADAPALFQKDASSLKSISEEQNEYRTVTLFFMDPDDALAVHAELKQMEQMAKSDIRITSNSLGKALRSASNLGNGLPTGYPIEALNGNLKPVEEGGSLRHKIMPDKRQLFYAARCIGKERVGLFGENPAELATMALLGNSAIESTNILRRREIRERKTTPPPKSLLEAQNAHMDGHTGIPVFHATGMARKVPKLKQLISGNRQETPMFFNYEDLQDAWTKMKKKNPSIPDEPAVEVFNLFDVLTSMDKDQWKTRKAAGQFDIMAPLRQRFGKLEAPELDSITFVPSSRSIDFKEKISARGNGKARLRPMR